MFKFVGGKISISIPGFGGLEGNWEPDDTERKAAWEIYVELVTRIATMPLARDEGVLREALTSSYSLFATSRDVLRKYGPEIARPGRGSDTSLGAVVITALNYVLRPLLAKWHPLLSDYENRRPPSMSAREWESQWQYEDELRATLERMRQGMLEYADVLARVAGVPPLHPNL